jgi:ribosomal protein RSM22 (predicted rRNA methylase)
MKLLKFILPAVLALGFAGCLDINEDVDIRSDGSGQLTMDMDMSQMVDLLSTYMGKDELQKKGMDKMDTTILLKDIVDTVSTMTADQKAILRPGRVHIKLDMDAKVFTVHSMFPFTSMANLQQLYVLMNNGSLGNAKLFGALSGGDTGGGSPGGVDQFNSIFDFSCKDGLLIKKLNKAKFDSLKNDPQLAQVKQATQMGMEINYTSTLTLPRPAKKVDNPIAKLSDDKKTVTMKFNLMDVFDHPDQFEYTVEY